MSYITRFPAECRDGVNFHRVSRLTITFAERNGRKTLTTVQGLPKKFDQKKILKVIKKKFGMSEPIAALDAVGWRQC